MATRPPKKPSGSTISPLSIFSTLITACDAGFVIAAVQTTGYVQAAFTVGAIFGILVIGVGFFRIITTRPEALLSPRDFNSAADMVEVIQAFRATAKRATEDAEEIYASVESLRELADKTKISYVAITGLQEQLELQAAELQKAKARATMAAFLAQG